MARKIERVAVLGAGVMGTGIAAHLAGAGLDVSLLDIVPPDLSDDDLKAGLTHDQEGFRNRLANRALQRALTSKPATFHDPSDIRSISPGNFDDHLGQIDDCDWIVEAVTEKLSVKQALFAKVDACRRPGSLITSNTSGLSIAGMVDGRSDDFVRSFFVTHFFNPVRYMRLLELVAGENTDPDAVQTMARFGADVLGKGIVFGKDTPNFVANRIGTYSMMHLLHVMERGDYTIEEIDTVFGQPMGRPKSAVFRTADLVGLDTLAHVADNCYEALDRDECRDTFLVPEFLRTMVKKGWLGQKSRQGFYRKVGSTIMAIDLSSFDYHDKQKVRAESIGAVRKIDDPGKRIKALLQHEDKLARLAWDVTARTLIYAARRIGEIADDVVNVDNALKWGYNWELGPFELWDAIGVKESVDRMQRDGMDVPEPVGQLLSRDQASFYAGTITRPTYFDFGSAGYKTQALDPRWIRLTALREQQKIVERNASATLFDLGDAVLGLEFHSKMNAIDSDTVALLRRSIDLAEQQGLAGVVIGNEHRQAFCAGANLFALLVAAGQRQWDAIEQIIRSLQQATFRMRSSNIPVVAAPAGLALGGGAEIAMGADIIRAHTETYLGLVEVGVGVIPAGGGCWALLERFCGQLPDDPAIDPMPFIRQAFTNIAMAKVSPGAEGARRLGFLRPRDQVTFNRDLLLHDAKQTVLGMTRAGYRRPRPIEVRLPGASGAATFKWAVEDMRKGGLVTDHEAKIAGKLAWVLCGGETSTRVKVGQQQILDLEREAFLSLMGEQKTQERIQHMLQKGKPLRN